MKKKDNIDQAPQKKAAKDKKDSRKVVEEKKQEDSDNEGAQQEEEKVQKAKNNIKKQFDSDDETVQKKAKVEIQKMPVQEKSEIDKVTVVKIAFKKAQETFKQAKGASINKQEQIQDLLDYDKTSSEEEILGASFNIPYNGKFIPGNKIHKEMAWYENLYRKSFYEEDNWEYNSESFPLYYRDIESKIVESQKKISNNKNGFKKDLYSEYNDKNGKEIHSCHEDLQKLKDAKDYKKYKEYVIDGIGQKIGTKNKILEVDVNFSNNRTNKYYPNFAMAKLSYLKNGKIFSEIVEQHERRNLTKVNDHSEAQIFAKTKKIISEQIEKYKSADKVILDIHTALSMCPSCDDKSKELVQDVSSKIGVNKFQLRTSYNFPYNANTKQYCENGFLQKQIELTDLLRSRNTIFSPENIIASSGYIGYKGAISNVDKYLSVLYNKTSLDVLNKDLKIKQNGYWYSDDDITRVLQHQLPEDLYRVMPIIELEHEGVIDNVHQAIIDATTNNMVVVMPLQLYGNHWAGVVFRNIDNVLHVIYNAPRGHSIELHQNAVNLIEAVTGMANALGFQNLMFRDLRFMQQLNDDDCGPYTVDNLIRLAHSNIGNFSDDQLRNILRQPDPVNQAHTLRSEHHLILLQHQQNQLAQQLNNLEIVEQQEQIIQQPVENLVNAETYYVDNEWYSIFNDWSI